MAKPRGFSSGFAPGFGVGRYRYALTPWVWETSNPAAPHWRLPDSAVGGVDLRPLPAQAQAGGSPAGFAFAASLQPVDGVEIATALHMAEESATVAMRDAWQSAMSYRPAGDRLVDLLWDQLTAGSDPTGQAGPKPLVPGVDGLLRLFVGGHSQVKSERFRWGIHPHTNRLRDLLRRDFETMWEATNGHDHCRRRLDFTCEKYGVSDWREFVPARLHAHVPGRLPHQTTITESFDTADSDTLGPDLTWAEVTGDWDVVTNAAELQTSGGNRDARAESDLSSDDHYAQAVWLNGSTGDHAGGAAARFDAAAQTHYRWNPYGTSSFLAKMVAGTATTLGTGTASPSSNTTYKVQADGSTIAGYENGAEKVSLTDTAITGNLRAGIVGYHGGGAKPRLDDFEAADLAAGGPTTQNLAGSVTPAGTLAKLVAQSLAGSLTPSGALAKAAAKVISGAATAAGTVVNDASKALAGSSTPTGTVDNVTVKVQSVGGSSTPAGSLTKDVSQAKAGSTEPAGAVTKDVSKSLAGQVAPAGALAKRADKALSGSTTPAGGVSNARAVVQALAGAVSAAGSLVKSVLKALAGLVTPSGSVTNDGGEPTAVVQVVDLVATDSSEVDLVATDSSTATLTARRPT